MIDFNDLPNTDLLPDTSTEDSTPERTEINVYRFYGQRNELDKTNKLTNTTSTETGLQGTVLIGSFKDPFDFINPTLYIQDVEPPKFNYLRINCSTSAYGLKYRYYFVDRITCISKNIYEVECTEDVLMTFKNIIEQYGYGMVDRNEFLFNDLIPDNKRVIYLGETVTDQTIYNNVFIDERQENVPNDKGVWVITGLSIETGLNTDL